VAAEVEKLRLGKGVFFAKTQLRRLSQEDDTWEADFFPIPCGDGEPSEVWVGLVLSHTDDYILAQRTVAAPPTVNDLANLLAEAMRRPLVEFAHRPQTLYLRSRPEWAELLPHLREVGIRVVCQETLPKWDAAFGDLYAQVEQARSARRAKLTRGRTSAEGGAVTGKGGPMARTKKAAAASQQPGEQSNMRLYTLEVFLLSGPISEKFAKKNPVISRTIQIRGDQTLEDLHHAIFDAFGRWEEHLYEFQFGKGPMDPKGPRYVLPSASQSERGEENPPAGRVDTTPIESLGLKVGDRFGYWFDFGDDWWHQINVEAIEDKVPKGKLPKVTRREGKSPPQYADEDE
jgi:hypothetical protein